MKTVLHIYKPADKQRDPGKAKTGLFFFRGKPGAPFAVIAPGGGFSYVGAVHESFPYAMEISSKGYNAFVVVYRSGRRRRYTRSRGPNLLDFSTCP